MPVTAADLVAESRTVPGGGVGGQFPCLGERPAHPAVPSDDGGLVGDGEHGGEPDAEPPDGARPAVSVRTPWNLVASSGSPITPVEAR